MRIPSSMAHVIGSAAQSVARVGFDQIDQAIEGLKSQTEGFLGDERIQTVSRKAKEALEKWMGDNPGAPEAKILEKSKEAFSNAQTSEFINKMFDDAFLAKIMDRIKEISQENFQ